MTDSPQNPTPREGGNPPPGSSEPGPPPGHSTQPPGTSSSRPSGPGEGGYGTAPPPPPPGQGSYGTAPPPPPPGGWQRGGGPGTGPSGRPGPYPPAGATGGVGQPADLMPRFAARLLDFLLIGVVEAIVGSVIVAGVFMGRNAGALTGWGIPNGAGWAANAVTSVITAAISIGYFTLMESSRGQTVGKMIMRLETRGPEGGRPTPEQALKRNAFTAIGALGAIPFVGVFSGLLSLLAVVTIAVTISNDRVRRHGWHDELAGGTTVFRIG